MKFTRVEHIGIVVKDLNKSIDFFRDILGMPLEEVEDLADHKIRIALLPVGESMVELIEDQDRDGTYSTFIAERGEGIHHICFEVRDIHAALKELKQAGVPLHNEEPVRGHQNSRILFFNPPGGKDLLIELCEKAERANEEV